MSRKPIEFDQHPFPFPDGPVYRAYCAHVVDGDTFDVLIDLGLYNYAYVAVRLKDVDTPEIYRPADAAELEAGRASKAFLEAMILDQQITIQTYRDRTSFGRFVAHASVQVEGAWVDVGTFMIEHGHAVRA